MQKITSRENPKLKFARRVRDSREKGSIFVEGVRLAEEALRSRAAVNEIFVSGDFNQNERTGELIQNFQSKNISINEVSAKIFGSIADTKTSQGIILICEKPETRKETFETEFSRQKDKLPVVVFLHEINNPSNLGAILRTAEAVNAAGIVISENSADVFSPKSLRASMGAGFRLNLWTNAGFTEVLEWAREKNLVSTAADVNAAKSYSEIDWTKPRLLVFGSEAHGLSAENFREIDESLIIPMENEVESLNLAVSCGIILFEAKRQSKTESSNLCR
ncbi:MAG TPA: RNA methyltransferase [Pyrinomonadaceae bacterium]|jgi:TrmH family RNA methyltransferase